MQNRSESSAGIPKSAVVGEITRCALCGSFFKTIWYLIFRYKIPPSIPAIESFASRLARGRTVLLGDNLMKLSLLCRKQRPSFCIVKAPEVFRQSTRVDWWWASRGGGPGGEGEVGAVVLGPIGQMGIAGDVTPLTTALAQIHGLIVCNCTSSKLTWHGLPLRQEIIPGDATVPLSRRNVMFLVLMLFEASPSVPQSPPTPTNQGAP
jgi:hypothetical protein